MNSLELWSTRLNQIRNGETVMNTNVHRPEPYFGKGMDKDRSEAFCLRMIEEIKKNDR